MRHRETKQREREKEREESLQPAANWKRTVLNNFTIKKAAAEARERERIMKI